MKAVRRIEIPEATIGHWTALDELMLQELYEGTFEDTCVVFRWRDDVPSLGLSPYDDADHMDFWKARSLGCAVGRRLATGGGTGLFTPEFLMVAYYYRKRYQKPAVTLHVEADTNGEANATALRKLGFPARYRSIGDTEIVIGEEAYKVIANGPSNMGHPELFSTTTSVVWGTLPRRGLEILQQTTFIPPEKFEDKKVKSFAGRLKPLVEAAAELGLTVSLEQVVDAAIEENLRALMDGRPVPANFRPQECTFVQEMLPFFEGPVWHNRLSTRRLCQRAPRECRVGAAAYKSRKLIKASVVVDEQGRIHEAMFTGDVYIRPQPTVTEGGAMEMLSAAIRGLLVDDEVRLQAALAPFWERADFEAPLIEPEHFVAPVIRAGQKLQPIEQYLEQRVVI